MEMVRKKSAVGYIRCSTDMQEDSPEQQKVAIAERANSLGYDVTDWYEDFGQSGTTFDLRPGFQQLKKTVENGRTFNTVFCYDESRWGRAIDPAENSYWMQYFKRLGVTVILVKTSVDPKSEFADVLGALERSQASSYSKKVSELTLRGAKSNRKYSNGGSAPYGYVRVAINTKTDSRRELAPGEWSIKGQEKVTWGLGPKHEIDTVRMIYMRRASGDSYMLIAMKLNDQGVPCPKRGRWRNRDQKWSPVTVKSILENHVYYGTRVYNRNSMSKIMANQKGKAIEPGVRYPHWINDPSEWIIEESAHEGIVTKDEWQKANTVRPPEQCARSKPRYDVPYLLTGLITCSRCGFPFQGQSKKARNKHYYTYVCGGYNGKRVCTHCAIKRDQIEQFVLDAIKDTLTHPTILKLIEEKVRALLSSRNGTERIDLKAIERSISIQEQSAKNLAEAVGDHGPLPTLMKQLQGVEKELTKLRAQREQVMKMKEDRATLDEAGSRVADFILNFEKRIANVPIHEKKDLVRRIVSKIIVDRDANVVRCYVRKVPAVTTEIEDIYTRAEKTQRPEERRCATSPVAGTGLEPATFGL